MFAMKAVSSKERRFDSTCQALTPLPGMGVFPGCCATVHAPLSGVRSPAARSSATLAPVDRRDKSSLLAIPPQFL